LPQTNKEKSLFEVEGIRIRWRTGFRNL